MDGLGKKLGFRDICIHTQLSSFFELFNTSSFPLNPTISSFRATTSSRSKEYINAANVEEVSISYIWNAEHSIRETTTIAKLDVFWDSGNLVFELSSRDSFIPYKLPWNFLLL